LAAYTARAAFILPPIERPSHASKNPTATPLNGSNCPQILLKNQFLIHLIKRIVEESLGARSERMPCVVEDWWPNHTRYIELELAQCTVPFLEALHALLADEFRNYRIQLCVYEDQMKGTTYIGSLALYADNIVIEDELNKRLGFDRSLRLNK
jgi:hypothetical protein